MWSKHKTSILVGLSFTVFFSLLWLVQSVAIVIFISVFLAILLTPLVDYCCKKLPRSLSSFIVLFSFVGILAALIGTISKTFLPTFALFVTDLPELVEQLPLLNLPPGIAEQITEAFNSFASLSMTALRSSLEIILTLFSRVMDIIFILFITFYLLKDGIQIKTYLANLFPHNDTTRVRSLFDEIIKALSSYIHGQLLICIITGFLVFLYFFIFDLPYSSVFAAISAIGEFIPVIGPTIASLFGSLLAFTVSPALGAQTMLFYLVLTQLNHNVVYPYLIGKSLNLHPIAILLSITLGGQLLGPVGMFLAVPVMVIIKIIIEDIAHHQ